MSTLLVSRLIFNNLSKYRSIVLIQKHCFKTCSIQLNSKKDYYRRRPPTTFLLNEHYKVLGVSKTSSDKDIKNAYLKLAKKFHPDANKSDPNAKIKFQEISEAYECISNVANRNELIEFTPSYHLSQRQLFEILVFIVYTFGLFSANTNQISIRLSP